MQKLPVEQARELQDWLADYLEDDAELNPEFVARIARAVHFRSGASADRR